MTSRKTRVLIADNNRDLCEVITSYISMQNDLEVVGVAYDGRMALKLINQYRPDVILLDIVMPELDGIGVIENLPNHSYEPLIIVLTAFEQDSIVGELTKKKTPYYMVKPVDFSVLMKTIREFTEREKGIKKSGSRTDTNYALEAKISETFHRLGIPVHFRGYSYLKEAIILAVEDEEKLGNIIKNLYPQIAKRYQTTIKSIESAIRYTINTSWERGNRSYFQEIFANGNLPSTEDKSPTIAVFIAKIADLIRLEIKQENLN